MFPLRVRFLIASYINVEGDNGRVGTDVGAETEIGATDSCFIVGTEVLTGVITVSSCLTGVDKDIKEEEEEEQEEEEEDNNGKLETAGNGVNTLLRA